jgi:hypothetical protein
MDATIDDFRQHFQSLSDEGLLAVNRKDLVEMACQCYDVELAQRGLKPLVAAAEDAAPDQEQPQELVAVATFTWAGEAKLAEALLRSESIPCFLRDEHTIQMNWCWGNALGGLRLMVPAEFAERAREILGAQVSEQELEAQAESAETENQPPQPE